MNPIENNIIVKADEFQKREMNVEGVDMLSAKDYSDRWNEKNPVVALVEKGCGKIKRGMLLLCNYNYFDEGSPYRLYSDMFSIPIDDQIFGYLDSLGELQPLNDNIVVQSIPVKTPLPVPEDKQKLHDDRGFVLRGLPHFKPLDFIFFMPMSIHEIIYNWKGKERRVKKVHLDEVVGFVKKT